MAEYENNCKSNNEQNESTVDRQHFQLLEEFKKIKSDQKKFHEEMLENQRVLMEKMETIQKRLDGRKRKIDDEGLENQAKRASNSVDVSESHQVSSGLSCKFVLRHVFENVSKLKERKSYINKIEEHFGVPWGLHIRRKEGHLAVFLDCKKSENIGKWSIETEYELKIVHPNGKSVNRNEKYTFAVTTGRGYNKFVKWEGLLEDYLVDDKLIVEAHVNINKMTGIYKENLRSFDETMNDVSDVVLIIQDEKFFVSKLFLATHSFFFKAMFLGQFNESKKSEIKLSGINSGDFQKYLEVLYGEYAIDEATVEGILLVADMYDTPIVIRKCEEFILEKSAKTLKKKLQMSIRYNLEKVKKKCLSNMKTADDIRSVIPEDLSDLDPSISNILLEKSLSFK